MAQCQTLLPTVTSLNNRSTLVMCGGGDGSGEELYFWAGREAMKRGCNLLVFHGPGQRGALHQDASLVFRYDYEVPLKAVMDYVVSRPDVDEVRKEFYDMLQCPKQSRFFITIDGADSHCQINNLAMSYQVAFAWLAEIFKESKNDGPIQN